MPSVKMSCRLAAVVLLAWLAGCGKEPPTLVCPPDVDYCIDEDGNRVNRDGTAITDQDNVTDQDGDGDSSIGDADGDGGGDSIVTDVGCECAISGSDTDGDCIPDNLETVSSPNNRDTDGDGINDGCEDRNRDGIVQNSESNPNNPDTDGDGIPDGIEDTDQDGRRDPGESNPVITDSDRDGTADGAEDADHDGVMDPWTDTNGNNCFDRGVDTPGETDPASPDSDGDGIGDKDEDKNANGVCDAGETCAFLTDTDCDGIADGVEDANRNGILNSGETDPLDADTDNDGLPDGVEDANKNGKYDIGSETSALLFDTDADRVSDGNEDRNKNGVVDPWTDVNGNGCYDPGVDTPGEANPRSTDSDNDGVRDAYEDLDADGECDYGQVPDPLNPGMTIPGFIETCVFIADTECDGLADGVEDVNRNGRKDPGELDARSSDSDFDGLIDGCPALADQTQCEDKDNDGDVDPGETDPRNTDSDFDFLNDGCEVNFSSTNCDTPSCSTNPLNDDTDGDGALDGEEDSNRNCQYDPGSDDGDPRRADPPPTAGTEERVQFDICAAQNLKKITYVESLLEDYRVAFEMEKNAGGVEQAYVTRAYGLDDDNDGVVGEDDADDRLWGHVFQSPGIDLVDTGTGQTYNRDVYGFTFLTGDGGFLDDILDDVRDELTTLYGGAVVEVSNLPARPAHDDLPPNFRVFRAQRQYRINSGPRLSALFVRNDILGRAFLNQQAVEPAGVLDSATDPVYGQIVCPSDPRCYQNFTMSIAAVQRLDQNFPRNDVMGEPKIIVVVAITPNDSNPAVPTAPQNRLYADRLTRLDDLTGGSAVARYQARVSSTCERKNPNQAKADLLWVVDDSRSMQAVIDRLQQASADAQAVLTSNSAIVDFRTALTTTNASAYGRRFCPDNCLSTGSCVGGGSVDSIGCIKMCPGTCSTTCTGGGCPGTGEACTGSCFQDPALALDAELAGNFGLPGGGGGLYYEDTLFWDCDSTATGIFIQRCNQSPYASEFGAFFAPGARSRFPEHARFLSSDPDANCQTAPLDLWYKTTETRTGVAGGAPSDCNTAAHAGDCCDHLTAACSDGPTVLSSMMCDLVRSMGGTQPDPTTGFVANIGDTSGARPHSSPETGTRSARRVIQSMVPALPADYSGGLDKTLHMRLDCTSTGSLESCETDADCGPYDYCDVQLAQPICKPTGNCVVCDPREGNPEFAGVTLSAGVATHPGASGNTCPGGLDSECGRGERCGTSNQCIVDCRPVPLLTIFLSDEEDFYFKDECSTPINFPPGAAGWEVAAQRYADRRALPQTCYFRILDNDGDGQVDNPPLPEPCYEDAVDPLDYCGAFYTDAPDGYDPDNAPYLEVTADNTLKWRTSGATQCSGAAADREETCVADPCRLFTSANCAQGGSMCVVADGLCMNRCTAITWVEPASTALTSYRDERTACNNDPACFFDQSLVESDGQQEACVPKFPLNDCQACKRLRRRIESVQGECPLYNGTGTCSADNSLIGFGDVGPVYAMVRQRGKGGSGGLRESVPPEDTKSRTDAGELEDSCFGGPITWGRGDGSAYRDIAIDTFGRAQDVCAQSYQDFMQLLVTDIVALSAPYRLKGAPISATIKVGIGRPGAGGLTTIEVPRSTTSGFIYDATSNSIGFKSDPIDGQCASGCSANSIIEASEIDFARTAPHVPRDGDVIFISYRFWRPVPCAEQCAANEECVRTICSEEDFGDPCQVDSQCPGDDICISGFCQDQCAPGDYLDRCEVRPCAPCEERNVNGLCVPSTDTCACPPVGVQTCEPTSPNSCPLGFACDESCVCIVTPGCAGAFNSDGSVADCAAAKACCIARGDSATACPGLTSQMACDSTADAYDCEWIAGANRCDPRYPACCGVGETPECYFDPENPTFQTLYCDGTCECGGNACMDDNDCTGGSKCRNGTCACEPAREYCCVDCGCECRLEPN